MRFEIIVEGTEGAVYGVDGNGCDCLLDERIALELLKGGVEEMSGYDVFELISLKRIKKAEWKKKEERKKKEKEWTEESRKWDEKMRRRIENESKALADKKECD